MLCVVGGESNTETARRRKNYWVCFFVFCEVVWRWQSIVSAVNESVALTDNWVSYPP